MSNDLKLTEGMEDYLEMFYRIIEKQGYIRASDLSTAIKVNPSSVTRMLQRLHDAGFITYQKYHNITMTDKGLTYGRFLVWRDETLNEFLRFFKANVGIAEQVEGIEHYITPATMKVFQSLIFFFKEHHEFFKELEKYQNQRLYPENEELGKLRAWLFKHNND
jgi:Mn-dependent DtxR family transcriptional regulator